MSWEEDQVPAELVAGKYRLTRMLGRGGMGSVWEGVHTSLGTRVAVKFIESEYADSDDARNRFENEARAAATLTSKHVVKVYDHGMMPDGRPYIVMEFLAGEPLDTRLERLGRLGPQETTRIMLHVARALAKAHQAGIVHRDLKPENVFLVWDDEDNADVARVVDFGIAKFTNADMGVSSSTRTGSVLGTPHFMSPEQARGLRSVDYRTDLWALGVITYRCLVGSLPFTGEAVGDLLVKICTAPIPVPSLVEPALPQAFDAWFAKALDREPAQRFSSAMEMVEALASCFGGRPELGPNINPYGVTAMPMQSAQVPGTAGSGAYAAPMATPQAGLVQAQSAGTGQTEASFHVTPPPGVPKKSHAGLIAAVVVAVLLVAAGGIAVAVRMQGQAAAPAAADQEPSADVPKPQAGPEVVPAEVEKLAPPKEAKPDEDSEKAEPEKAEAKDDESDEPNEKKEPKTAKAKNTKPSAASPAPRPVAAPRPAAPQPPPQQTAPRPRPTSPPKKPDELDVGY